MVKLKILRIWVVLFVLICDCFVVNILDRICSLSCWFLVCLEDNNVIFGQWFCLESMFNRIYQNFCSLVKRMDQIFLNHLKLFFFSPYYPFFSKILGPPFHLGALGNCLIRLRVGPALSLWSAQHFVSLSSYRDYYLFLHLSYFFLSFFFCKHRVFCIYVLLSFSEQFRDRFWWAFGDWEEKILG